MIWRRFFARDGTRTWSNLGPEIDDLSRWFPGSALTVNYQAHKTAQEMYRRMFAMKFLPPGRGLWAMGSKLTTERRLYAALNNCAFVSTKGEL